VQKTITVAGLTLAAALLLGTSGVPAPEQQRDTSETTSRSYDRPHCLPDDCEDLRPLAKPSPSPSLVPAKPQAPKSNCPKNVSKVWSGPCPPAPSKAQVQDIMRQLLAERGWGGQFDCLNYINQHESDFNVYAVNPNSLAYGIPQALPGKKMASAGPDWGWNARTQLKWELGYIAGRYGDPCGASSFWQAHHWY